MSRRSAASAVAACAVIVAVVFGALAGLAHRSPDEPRREPAQAAAAAVTALMTFAPGDSDESRRGVEGHLTGVLAADYARRGPDVVFPSAVASKVTMTVDVTDAGVVDEQERSARVLVFADQTVVVGEHRDVPSHTGIARWAWMTRVEGHWLMARLTPVSPQ
ncbi:hypothetical protein [Gordonia humi]|uniref:Mce-associated membrane protein n=1 Tax=Gordonia humi TaxID=686429 RepID=A0A840EXB0_9ACTN|nr:hypothetical protein [Gordonia humi]MBB4134954.1 hypothetical protein [Gordonia humi]